VENPIARSIILLTPVVMVFAASGASAAILVDFENDPVPFNVPNGFASSDSSQIHFSDTDGADLVVLEIDGSHALAVFFDDDSGLLMEFDFVASALSLDFGNTSLANFGDTAVLTVYMGGSEVGSSVLALDGTGAIDQTISYAGATFDSAIFRYNVANSLNGLNLTEVVDNIYVTPAIPEPQAGLVFGMGALMVGAVCGRRPATRARPRGVHD
jgi:hypothetical protein